jgi:hypothetical protein
MITIIAASVGEGNRAVRAVIKPPYWYEAFNPQRITPYPVNNHTH